MNTKTIKKTIASKMEAWLKTIDSVELAKDVKKNLLVSGGSIASMFLSENVNDFDVYIKDKDVLLRLVEYYTKKYALEVLDGAKKKSLLADFSFLEEGDWGKDGEEYQAQRYVAIKSLKEDQVKILTSGYRVEYAEELKEGAYLPVFFSPNAISLSDDIQIVNRFHGDSEAIHKTFDFIHATNYFTFGEGLVTNKEALESLLTRRLKYQGSMYPLTSIIRSKKFIKRGWNIGAGEYLKIMFQISELNLKDPEVLDDQLIGVDVAYFSTLIEILRGKFEAEPAFQITSSYLNTLIEKVFDEVDEEINV